MSNYEYNLEFPKNKQDCMSFHLGLEVMLKSREYFKNNGFMPRNSFHNIQMVSQPARGQEMQGMYTDQRSMSGNYDYDGTIICKDGTKIGAEEFAKSNDIDRLMDSIIKRQGVLVPNYRYGKVWINTFMVNHKYECEVKFCLMAEMENRPDYPYLSDYSNLNRYRLNTLIITEDVFKGVNYWTISGYDKLDYDIRQEELESNRRR